jgi:spermidine synthase
MADLKERRFSSPGQRNLLEAFTLFAEGKEQLDALTLVSALRKFGIEVSNAHDLLPEPVDYTQFTVLQSELKKSPRPPSPKVKATKHIHTMEPGDVIEEPKDYFIVKNGVRYAGTHLIIDLYGAIRLDDIAFIEQTLTDCVTAAKATLLDMNLHHFTPNGGVSGVAVLAESHISIHSWPEHKYAALDIFTCGSSEPHNAVEVLRAAFKPERLVVEEHLRGKASHSEWFEEQLHPGYRTRFETNNIIYETGNNLQRSLVFEHQRLGRVLMIDDIVQTSEADEFVYHEAMTHVPMFAHGNAKKVLVIGGGDGGIIEEVLKHKAVERCVMVEIDRSVVDIAEQYFPTIHKGAFNDPRMELIIADGYFFVGDTDERFDVIIVDSCDPVGPAAILFSEEFYARCKRCLTPGGILVTQSGVPFWQADELRKTHQHRTKLFKDAGAFVAAVPQYVGGFLAFGWGSDDETLRHVSQETLEARLKASGISTQYYSAAVHRGCFALPPYIAKLV